MKKSLLMVCLLLTLALTAGSVVVFADDTDAETEGTARFIPDLPSETLVALLSGKTVEAENKGYGFGDDINTATLDFTIVEPVTYKAEDIESLEAGNVLLTTNESYTVKSTEEKDGVITVTPDEEWLEPLTLTKTEKGTYIAETPEGPLTSDGISFTCRLNAAFEFVSSEGETMGGEELMNGLSEGTISLDFITLKLTFDENAVLTKVEAA